MAERCPITGTSLYLVLKSNGPHRSKNPPVRFSFSPKTVPANIAKKLPSQRCFKPLFIASFNFSHKRRNVRFKGLRRVHTPPHPRIVHTSAHTVKQGLFQMGCYYYPRSVPHVHKHPRAGYQNGKFCRFWGLVGGAPKERRKPSEQRCAYARRCSEGVAAPLGCVIFFQFCRNCDLYAMRACARHGRYHYPQRALRAAETPDGRLSKRLICRFLRSGGRSSPHDSYFLANTQNFLLAVPVANTFALWYDKFDKLELSN